MTGYQGNYEEALPALQEFAGLYGRAVDEVRSRHAGAPYDKVRQELVASLSAVGIKPIPQVLDDLSRQISTEHP